MKILKKFNLLDWCILACLVAMLAVAGIKIFGVNAAEKADVSGEAYDTDGAGKYFDCECVIKKVSQSSVDNINVGDRLYNETTDAYIGEVISVDAQPYISDEFNSEGEVIECVIPESFSVNLVLRCPVVEKDNGYFFSGKLELKVNSEYSIYSKYLSTMFTLKSFEPEA